MYDIMSIVQMIIDSWIVNKCTHTNWLLKHGITCYNSMETLSIHLIKYFNHSNSNSYQPTQQPLSIAQSKCVFLLASFVYSITQTTIQLAIPPPPRDQTYEVHYLWALHWLGHEQWTCKKQGLVVTLVLENKLDLLVVMPTKHGK
jgi:hypothetical protein